MFRFKTEPKVCEVGGVKFGGQPGEYPTVIIPSIFQKGDKVFEGKRKEGFDRERATELVKMCDKLCVETGIPYMADIVGTKGEEFKTYIDFFTEVTCMPFCVDAWVMKPKLEAAAYCAEKGLLDRMFYNSLTVWEKDVETEIKEIASIGVKHVLLVAFDPADQMPTGRISGTQKLLDAIDKVGAKFESLFVDTSVMNGPATALCSLANKLIKEKWGFPLRKRPFERFIHVESRSGDVGSERLGRSGRSVGSISSCFYHDMIFSGPMAGSDRIFPAVAMADAFTATLVYGETKKLPELDTHPLKKLFPEFSRATERHVREIRLSEHVGLYPAKFSSRKKRGINNMATMTPKERVKKFMKKEPVDTMPIFSGMGMVTVQAINKMGIRFAEVHGSAEYLANSATISADIFGFDSVIVPYDMCTIPEAMGRGCSTYANAEGILYPTVPTKWENSMLSTSILTG